VIRKHKHNFKYWSLEYNPKTIFRACRCGEMQTYVKIGNGLPVWGRLYTLHKNVADDLYKNPEGIK
jgi:hypothetical protein